MKTWTDVVIECKINTNVSPDWWEACGVDSHSSLAIMHTASKISNKVNEAVKKCLKENLHKYTKGIPNPKGD